MTQPRLDQGDLNNISSKRSQYLYVRRKTTFRGNVEVPKLTVGGENGNDNVIWCNTSADQANGNVSGTANSC